MLAQDEAAVAVIDDDHAAQHLTNDDLNVLIVDLHALQAVHILHFIGDVAGQRFHALQLQDVMRISRAINDRFPFVNDLAIVCRDVFLFRDQIFVSDAVEIGDDQTLLALRILTERYRTRNFSKQSRILRRTRLEQLGHTRQAAGNVARLRRLLRDTRHHFANANLLAVLDRDNRADLESVVDRDIRIRLLDLLALLVDQLDRRAQALAGGRTTALRIDHHQA